MDRTRFGLTPHQRELLHFVHSEITSGRVAPSFEEIKVHLGLRSKSNVHRLVEALVERGWLVRLPNRARSLALPSIPLPGNVDPRSSLTIQVSLPRGLAGRLAMFCADRCRTTDDVVSDALNAHLRWSA